MKLTHLTATLAGALALAGCVSVPQAPTVAVMPGADKSLDQFRSDSSICQQFAQSAVAGPSQAAHDNAATNAVGGAAVGAAVGALIGAATGQAGAGAAWGAGTGLLFGGTAAGNSGAASSYNLQRQFDIAYMQCMYTRGNQVPGQVARRTLPAQASPSYGYAPPPRGPYSAPPNAAAPPPDTPPPPGYAAPASPPPQ
jgi:uncharacterized protein YcfJ